MVAPGDDEFTLLRKSIRDLGPIQRRIAQARRDDLMTALLAFKGMLLDAVKAMGREGDL